ncbi:MAG: indole-3-glycerol phosphate synthase/phosphoribosylanthranilate isomerase [Flavobacteriales bacterium]|jgi:indole-3-glycerol phosphate synthase/phosphoribosylanthranilate isomerase
MYNKLLEIISSKEREVALLHQKFNLDELKAETKETGIHVYQHLRNRVANEGHFFISEFKRKSPSEGNINQWVFLDEQLDQYAKAGTTVVSVLTDTPFFGGDYTDLKKATAYLKGSGVLILQKDFIIDPIQIYLARSKGAHMVLLIARILEADKLEELKNIAESLGMGVLLELHDEEEYDKVSHLRHAVLGVNNRDLDNFNTYINRFNVLADKLPKDALLVAESGMHSVIDFAMLKSKAHGYLVGTSLMRTGVNTSLNDHFGLDTSYFFKACGLRFKEHFTDVKADLIGVNFSGLSKRAIKEEVLSRVKIPNNSVAVFKNNTQETILEIMNRYPFKYAQIYIDDIPNLEMLQNIKAKIAIAGSVNNPEQLEQMISYANYADLFILDGPKPGEGMASEIENYKAFPFPFLMAGGMNSQNLDRILDIPNCIGVDMASGLETDGELDPQKSTRVYSLLKSLKQSTVC